ncbi:MAG: HD domain-containing protein [Lachnospiraceae bacterium]|nr:HD domain-containing protein [Lachnospiraceae bacterium]
MREGISSKDICRIILEALRLIDKRLIDHGERVAYLIWRMMEYKGGFEEYELAEYAFIAALHDIGAFKVERGKDVLDFDVAHPMKHSIYGYLFMKYTSPIEERSKILMYSHIDFLQLKDVNFEGKEISEYIHLAGRYDLFHNSLGDRFGIQNLKAYEGKKFSARNIELLESALVKNDVEDKFRDGSYKKELNELWKGLLFSEKEKQIYIRMLIYISGFNDEYNVINTMTSTMVATEIAGRIPSFSQEEMTELFIGSALHDIGMLTVPEEIINAPRKLTDDEMKKVRSHVETLENVLKDRVSDGIMKIALGHHERLDGSGYPYGWTVDQMSEGQKILQVADIVTALTCERAYHPAKNKESVIRILEDEMNRNKYDREVVMTFIQDYDNIMTVARSRSEEMLSMFKELKVRYEKVRSTLMR